MADKHKHSFGGRVYREVTKSTFLHIIVVGGVIQAMGLDRMLRQPDEDVGDFGVRVTNAVCRNVKVLELLGGLLVPDEIEDLAWTPDIAKQTARALGELSDPEEQTRIADLVGRLVTGFFAAGVFSHETSRSSFALPTLPLDSSEIGVN